MLAEGMRQWRFTLCIPWLAQAIRADKKLAIVRHEGDQRNRRPKVLTGQLGQPTEDTLGRCIQQRSLFERLQARRRIEFLLCNCSDFRRWQRGAGRRLKVVFGCHSKPFSQASTVLLVPKPDPLDQCRPAHDAHWDFPAVGGQSLPRLPVKRCKSRVLAAMLPACPRVSG